jgi:hypothetical protein
MYNCIKIKATDNLLNKPYAFVIFPLLILSLKVMIKYKVNANIPINKRKGPTLVKNAEKNPILAVSGRFNILLIKKPTIRMTPAMIKVYEEIETFALEWLLIDNATIDSIIPTNIKPL